MKIMVTGGTGFLGRHLVAKLKEKEHEVIVLGSKAADLTDITSLDSFKDVKFDHIYHLAVKTAAGGYCQKHPAEQFIINQQINTNVLNFWEQHQRQAKMIAFGSSCSYDDKSIKTEENYMNGRCETGYEVYGMSKRMLLVGLEAMHQEHGMEYMCFVPSTLYGEGYRLDDRHFIYDLIRKIYDAKHSQSEPVILWGDGHQRRELIYVKDAVKIILKNSEQYGNMIMNLSSGVDFSIREYAQKICDIVSYDFEKIVFDKKQFVGAKEKKMKSKFTEKENFTLINEGLTSTIGYYGKHHHQGGR
jgi:GDP-L-fucose synthase